MKIIPGLNKLSFFKAIAKTSIVSLIFSLFTMLNNILLVYIVSLEYYGKYAIIISFIQFCGPIGTLGQSSILRAIYTSYNSVGKNWIQETAKGMSISSLFYVLVPLLLPVFNINDNNIIILTGFILLFNGLLYYITSFLDADKKYISSSLLIRLPYVLLILPIIFMYLSEPISIFNLLVFFLIFSILTVFLGGVLIFKSEKRETETISLKKRIKGFHYIIHLLIHLLPNQGIIILAGRFFEKELVGIYSAIWTLFRPFWILYNTSLRITSVELAGKLKNQIINLYFKYNLIYLVLGLASFFIYPFITKLIYQNRFTEYSLLIYVFIIVNTILLTESLPKSYLSMRLPYIMTSKYSISISLGGLAGILFIINTSQFFGIYSIAIASLIIMLFRTISSYYFSIKELNKIN